MAAIRAQQNAPPRSSPPRFQFSLWWLMIAVSIVCVTLGVWEILPRGFIGYLVLDPLILGLAPTALVTCAVYARGDTRAFAIGALVPLILMIVAREGPLSVWRLGFWMLFVGSMCGALAVALRRWLEYLGDSE
jgi:hypothetical protein